MSRLPIVVLASLMVSACGDEPTSYSFDAVVTKKFVYEQSSEPFRLMLDVSLNGGDPERVECRVKNLLRPLWDGLWVGAKLKFQKNSTYNYTESTICSLLNDAKVVDVLGQAQKW